MIKKITIFYFVLVAGVSLLKAQDGTTLGTEFMFGFPQNYINDVQQNPEIFVSGKPGTIIKISQPAYIRRPWHGTYKLNDKGYWGSGPLERGDVAAFGDGKNQLGILLEASDTVSVYINSLREYSADGTVVLPIPSLGKEYYVSAYKENFNPYSSESQILIVAAEDSTNVMIWPAGPTKVPARGPLDPKNERIIPSHVIQLKKGECYLVQGTQVGNTGGADLTGTRVMSFAPNGQRCKPIAVYGGNACTNVGIPAGCGGYCDVVFDQSYPVISWGKEYIGMPLANRTMDRFRILAAEDSTLIYLNNSPNPLRDQAGKIIYINQGGFHELNHATGNAPEGPTKTPVSIRGSKPIAVTQYCASRTCEVSLRNQGDPFSIELSPNEQRITKMVFNVFQINGGAQPKTYTANILALRKDIGRITFDGRPIAEDNFYKPPTLRTIDGEGLTYAILQGITPGTHTIEAPNGFVGTVYEMATDESYGYAMGARLAPLNFKNDFLDGKYPQIRQNIDPKDICSGLDVVYTINDELGRYRFFTWDFGDGTTRVRPIADRNGQRGDTVRHTYSRSGTFYVTVGASKKLNPEICDNVVEYKFRVVIERRPFEGIQPNGPRSVCPDQKNVRYRTSAANRTIYKELFWEVVGRGAGIVTFDKDGNKVLVKNLRDTTGEVRVDWGEADNFARVKVRGIEKLGCWSDFDSIRVRVGRDPEVPADTVQGPEIVCSSDHKSATYGVKEPGGTSYYFWNISPKTGYRIINAKKDSSQINIEWLKEAYGKTYTIRVKEVDSAIVTCLPFTDLPEFKTYIYPKADTVLDMISVSYPPAGQDDDRINVQYELFDNVFNGEEIVSMSKTRLQKRVLDPKTLTQIGQTELSATNGRLSDGQIKPQEELYEYFATGVDNCPLGEQAVLPSGTLRSIYLRAEAKEATVPNTPAVTSLQWTPFVNRPDVTYSVYRKTESEDWKVYSTAPLTQTSIEYQNGDEAVVHRYKIQARYRSRNGNMINVWSNEASVIHAKDVFGTPMMTPNGDGKNDVLVIVNLRSHPVVGPKKMTIFNRWGQVVNAIEDYQNDWAGTGPNGEQLEGTYFYVVIDSQGGLVTRGAVTIVR